VLLAAVDFSVNLGHLSPEKNCDQARAMLQLKLPEWELRMENNPGGLWIHLDTKPVAQGRSWVFNP
jgi:hypothetical protein